MEKGALRCEPNISVRTLAQKAAGEYGTKVEVKNLNSFRAVRSSIAYELERQIGVIEAGGAVVQVNMGWDEEQAAHRGAALQRGRPRLPLLPGAGPAAAARQPGGGGAHGRVAARTAGAKRDRYEQAWGVRRIEATVLSSESLVASFFEQAVAAYGAQEGKPQRLATWMTGELFRLLYADGDGQDLRQIAAIKIAPAQFAALLTLVDGKVINPNTGKKVLDLMYATGDDPQAIVAREGLAMVSDTGVIDEAIAEIFAANAPPNWNATAAARRSSSASSWGR
jgi:aspartyl-tRNA(Asn)/glutamyl-tRNA(Gln) amidotransferase subunit B